MRATVGADAPAALAVYRPMHLSARVGARVAATFMARGLAIPRSEPLEGIEQLMSVIGLRPDALAHVRSSHGDRRLIAVAQSGMLRAVVKFGPTDDPDLHREAEVVEKVGHRGGAVSAPRLLWSGSWAGRFVVATEGVQVTRDPARVTLDQVMDVCVTLARGIDGVGPMVHGDLNPSNLLPVGDGYVLVDWEWSRFELDPLFDLAHFAVARGLASRSRPAAVVRRLIDPGSPGWRYLEAVGIEPGEAPGLVHSYLQRGIFTGIRGQRFRMAMWAELGRRPDR
jgi:hypothetical protein